MRKLALLLLPALLLPIAPAHASSVSFEYGKIARLAQAAVAIPADWDGTWTTVDSAYTCLGALQNVSAGEEILCGGEEYSSTAPGTGITLVCTGTADATTADLTCTGSGNVAPDCDANYSVTRHATRTGTTFFAVTTVNITYVGAGCFGAPPVCIQLNSHGTRTGPGTGCTTPTKGSTWGELKIRYR